MTVNLTLRRLCFTPDSPTMGVLMRGNTPLCLTLERSWQNNQQGISCIPPSGDYQVGPHNTPEKPNCWEIMNVQGRTGVLFHAGNSIIDTEGCILVGFQFAGTSITHSQDALLYLRTTLPQNFTLEVINP